MSMTLAPIAYSAGIAGSSQVGSQSVFPYGFYQLKDTATGLTIGASYPGNVILSAAATPINPATDDTLQTLVAAVQALTAQIAGQATIVGGVFLPAPSTLPTTLPAEPGLYWNDGGLLAIS